MPLESPLAYKTYSYEINSLSKGGHFILQTGKGTDHRGTFQRDSGALEHRDHSPGPREGLPTIIVHKTGPGTVHSLPGLQGTFHGQEYFFKGLIPILQSSYK